VCEDEDEEAEAGGGGGAEGRARDGEAVSKEKGGGEKGVGGGGGGGGGLHLRPALESFKFPMAISAKLTLRSPGQIEYVNLDYHNQKYIFPVGYHATRIQVGP
jgi:hypothetical protein